MKITIRPLCVEDALTSYKWRNNPNIWKELKISPDWLVPYIQKFGTYTDIIDRNIGYGSPLELDMSRNLPYARGGLLSVVPML